MTFLLGNEHNEASTPSTLRINCPFVYRDNVILKPLLEVLRTLQGRFHDLGILCSLRTNRRKLAIEC